MIDEEELEQFEQYQSTMNSRMTRDYRTNENNRDFEASNNDENFSTNDVRNFSTNASASAAAEMISSSKFQKFRRFEELTHQATEQNNLEEFEHDQTMMNSSISVVSAISSYERQMTNLIKVYSDEIKYEKSNDNFHFKIIIFHETC